MGQHVSTSARLHETSELVETFVRSNNSFENLVVWQESQKTVVMIYKLTRVWKDFGLKDQIQRAMVSVVSNIAEGYGRFHYQENIQFCRQARGSLYELIDHFTAAEECEYLESSTCAQMTEKTKSAIIKLNAYIKYLKTQKQAEK